MTNMKWAIAKIAIAATVSTNLSAGVLANELEITNIRVGQGDATLIQGPIENGKRINVLFDAGDRTNRDGGKVKSRDAGNIIRAVLNKKNIKTLDYVIISHFDADHIGGIVYGPNHGRSVLLGFDDQPGSSNDQNGGWSAGKKCWVPAAGRLGTGDDVKVLNWVDRGNSKLPLNKKGDINSGVRKYLELTKAMGARTMLDSQQKIDQFQIPLGSTAKMTVLSGNGFIRGHLEKIPGVNTENEKSLSFLVQYSDFDFLISGDMIGQKHGSENAKVERAVGKILKDQGTMLEVLHVNHHGANNGSESQFLELVKPRIAVISTGNGNGHGHPHNKVLKRLHDAGVDRIIQTAWGKSVNRIPEDVRDIHSIFQNDVSVRTDGKKYDVFTSRTFNTNQHKQKRKPTPKTNCDSNPFIGMKNQI